MLAWRTALGQRCTTSFRSDVVPEAGRVVNASTNLTREVKVYLSVSCYPDFNRPKVYVEGLEIPLANEKRGMVNGGVI